MTAVIGLLVAGSSYFICCYIVVFVVFVVFTLLFTSKAWHVLWRGGGCEPGDSQILTYCIVVVMMYLFVCIIIIVCVWYWYVCSIYYYYYYY